MHQDKSDSWIIVGFGCGRVVRFRENDSVELFKSVFANDTVQLCARELRPGHVVLGIGRVDWVKHYASHSS